MQVDVHVYHLLVHCNMIVWAFDVVIWYVTIRWYQWSSCIACLYWWNFTPSSQTSYAANMLAHGEYSYLSCYPWYVLPAVLQWTYACRYNVRGVIWSGLMTLFRMLHSNMIMFQYASTPFVLYNVVTIELEDCFDLVENVVVCTPVYIQEPHKWRVSCCWWLYHKGYWMWACWLSLVVGTSGDWIDLMLRIIWREWEMGHTWSGRVKQNQITHMPFV